MIQHAPGQSVVTIVAPFGALAVKFAIALHLGGSLQVPTAFGCVVIPGSVMTTRYHLVEFQVALANRDAGIDQG